jgi:hypothetical protein
MPKANQLEIMEELVSELTKNRPNQNKVKKLMEAQGLDYSGDPVEQMTRVLSAVSQFNKIKKQKRQVVEL